MHPLLRRIFRTAVLTMLIMSLPQLLMAQIPVPELTGRVVDLSGTLSTEEVQLLEKELAELETRKGSQIAILMVSTTDGEVIEDFSMRVAEAWKIGRKGTDDGILITVAKDDRKMRIEVGYGLEGVIADATAKRIISEQMAPEFRNGNFYAGLHAAVSTMTRLIDGEKLPPPSTEASFDEDDGTLGGGFFFGSAISSFVMHWFLPTPLAVILAALATWIVSMFFVGFSFSNLFFLSLAAVIGVTWYRFRGGGGSSSSGGWSSSGGSSGGFSGGGGSFGGGGSSGSW